MIRLLVMAAVLSVSPVSPLLLVLIPLGIMLVALRPNDVSALVTGLILLILAFASGAGSPDADWFAPRAWALLLGGGFVTMTLIVGKASLLSRSLGAVLIGGVAVGAAGVFRPDVTAGLDALMTERIHGASVVLLQWVSTMDLQADAVASMSRAITIWTDVQKQVYPAFLALASLPALAIGWYVLGRLTGQPEVPAPIRSFRFTDHLVWLLAAGLALYALPLGDAAARVGSNAALFMVALYVVRGSAIAVWLLAAAGATPLTWILLAIIGILLYPFVLGATFAVGMGDTWIDLRRRLASFRSRTNGD